MAQRLLLTLLALLTGLAAQIGPAQACASHISAAEISAVAERVVGKASRAPAALAQLPEPGLRNTRLHALLHVETQSDVAVASVQVGIDRSHE